MLEKDTLKAKLKKQLNSLNLDSEKEDKIVSELNYLSSLIVDLYSMEKINDQQETTPS
jgi:heme oxygenase